MKRVFNLVLILFANTIFAQNVDQLFEKKTFVKEGDTLNYRIMYPKDFNTSKQYPVVLFLHGAGERGSDNRRQLAHGAKLFASDSARTNYPAIVVFPQCPRTSFWAATEVDRTTKPFKRVFPKASEPTASMHMVIEFMETLSAESYVNQNQIYVGGLSMGGMGTFEILSRKPEMFAAAFAICGGGNPENAEKYAKKTAMWIFHGANDDVVVPELSIEMVTAILKYGGKPNFNLYAKDNHNSWDSTFAEPKLLSWLFSNQKEDN